MGKRDGRIVLEPTEKGQKSEPFGTNKKGQRSVRKPL